MAGRPVSSTSGARTLRLAAGLIVVAIVVAYANTFRVPFLFDDRLAIAQNSSVKDPSSLAAVFSPASLTTSGRPLLNLTFAVNHAWTGDAVWSYHAVNLGIHVLAALVFFGVVRRTLERVQRPNDWLACLVTLVWALHPLQTNAVTYISERAESLMGLFYLLTFYGFTRAATSDRPARWYVVSALGCYAGMATKETMVTAPFLMLLFDRVFWSASFGEALAKRRGYYAALLGAWIFLGYLMVATHHEVAGIGFNAGVDWLSYTLTEFKVVAWYLKLAFWPHPQVFDYGPEILETSLASVLPYISFVAIGLVITVMLFVRGRKAAGFLAAAFFILLSPTSSFVPVIGQPMSESRMYLPVAPVILLVAIFLYRRAPQWTMLALGGLALGFGGATIARNVDYRSELSIWGDTIAKRPLNSRGQLNLAVILAKIPGRISEAITHDEEAVRLRPDFAEAYYNLAANLTGIPGREAEVIANYEATLRLRPELVEAENNLANELAKSPERLSDAIRHYEAALKRKPDYAEAHLNLANKLARFPERMPEAFEHYEAALRLKPDFAEAHYNYANRLAGLPGRLPDAVAHYEAALRVRPGIPEAHKNLALALANLGRLEEAEGQLQIALELRPDYAEARQLLQQVRAARREH
ncbi:MAG: yrrB [Verrucomicrobia bacterium]|nr:yrrB [Verrucomicrobiota bacterium]